MLVIECRFLKSKKKIYWRMEDGGIMTMMNAIMSLSKKKTKPSRTARELRTR